MKKTVSFALVSAFLFLVMGCTLSMDEWVETEEDKGYNEVETVENDYMKLDYEYKKTTRSLTEDIQKYIVQIDDSVLYFLDNTPSDYLPKAGGQVVANCCEMFPMGLMARVLSVDKANGMFKVVTTEADIADCFEEFNLDLETNVFTGDEEEQERDTVETARATRSGVSKVREVTIRDWSMFKAAKDGVGRKTRSLEDDYDKDVDKKSEEESKIVIADYGIDDEIFKNIRDLTHNVINTFSLKGTSVAKTYMHKVVKLKDKYEKTYTRLKHGVQVSILIGHDFQKPKNDDDKHAISDKVTEMLKQRDIYKKYKEKVGASNLDDLELTVEIPIGGLPFGLLIRLKPIMDLSMGIYGSAEFMIWDNATETTTEIVNGKKKKDESKKLDLPSNSYDLSAFGSFSIAGGGEIFLGFGKKVPPKMKAFGVGAFANATLNFDLNLSLPSIGDYTLSSSDDAACLTAKAEVGGKVLTGGYFGAGDVKFLTKEFTIWDGWTKSYNPRIDVYNNYPVIGKSDAEGDYTQQNISFNFTDFGMHFDTNWATYRKPILAVYRNENDAKDKPMEVLQPDNEVTKLTKKKDYKFTVKNRTNGNLYAIPGVKDLKGHIELYPQYSSVLRPAFKPNIEYDVWDDDGSYLTQTKYKSSMTVEGGYPVNYHTYTVALPFTLRYPSYIPFYWDDWGVIFTVSVDGKMNPKSKYKSLKNVIKSSGKYAVQLSFSCKYDSNYDPVKVEAYVYYKPKGAEITIPINSYDQREYSYHVYKLYDKDPGDFLLNRYHIMDTDEFHVGLPDEYEVFKTVLDN